MSGGFCIIIMEQEIEELIESKNKLFLKNKKYFLENDWSGKVTIELEKGKTSKDEYKAYKASIDYKTKDLDLRTTMYGLRSERNKIMKENIKLQEQKLK